MNYKICTSILLAPVCLALGSLTDCSNSGSSTTHTQLADHSAIGRPLVEIETSRRS